MAMIVVAQIIGEPSPPTVPVAPPVVGSPAQQVLTAWRAGIATCAGHVVQPLDAPAPYPTASWAVPGTGPSVTYTFRLDAHGRPLGIARLGDAFIADAGDLGPALATSRFAPGEHRYCRITFTADRQPFDRAAVADVMAYTVTPSVGIPREAWERVKPAGTTCYDPAPEVLIRAFPDFHRLPPNPGGTRWSMVGYDLDARGRPVHVRTVGGTGGPALAEASRDAVARSRFERGARTGCVYPYWQRGTTLPAPEGPKAAALRPPDATCPAELPYQRQPTLTYPEAYRRRSIEGWAIVRFDVAPWGEIGNLSVLAAEPAAEMGEAALSVVRSATKPATSTGYVGCVDRVNFRMGGNRPSVATLPPTEPVATY